MNRRLRQLLAGFTIACAFAMIMPFQMTTAFAGSAAISFSDPGSTVGEEFNVSVKIEASDGDLGKADVTLSYDPNYLAFVGGNNASGDAGSILLSGSSDSDTTTLLSFNLKFKALKAGASTISVAFQEIYDKDMQPVTVTKTGSSSVKVKAPSTSSKEAGLALLKVSPGTLSPEFSTGVTSYTMSVGGDVDKITVSASAKDSKAGVEISGNTKLKTGANNVVCKVTAEDGQTVKNYKITVNKSATADAAVDPAGAVVSDSTAAPSDAVVGDLKVDYNKAEYSVAVSFDPAALPEGYTPSTCILNETEIMCGTGYGLTLIYLQDSQGVGSFFIYNQESGAKSPYAMIGVTARSILVLPIDNTITVPSGFTETPVGLDGNISVQGWRWESDPEERYCVVYGMNENGEKGLYRYDLTEKTFQRYFEDPAVKNKYDDADVENLQNEYNSILKDYNIRFIVIIALIVVCLILFFTVINLLLKRREPQEPRGGGGGSGKREESPTPAQRRAMEQNTGRSRSGGPSERDGRTGRGSEAGRDEAGCGSGTSRGSEAGRGSGTSRGSEAGRGSGTSRGSEAGRGSEAVHGLRRDSDLVKNAELDVYETRRREEPRVQREGHRDYTVRHDSGYEGERIRELERENRARQARERLERERREDDRRRSGARANSETRKPSRQRDDDGFEFMDLN